MNCVKLTSDPRKTFSTLLTSGEFPQLVYNKIESLYIICSVGKRKSCIYSLIIMENRKDSKHLFATFSKPTYFPSCNCYLKNRHRAELTYLSIQTTCWRLVLQLALFNQIAAIFRCCTQTIWCQFEHWGRALIDEEWSQKTSVSLFRFVVTICW